MLTDNYGRRIDYLRISVTDKCNLRCIYCMPASGIISKPHEDLLTFEEIARIVKIGAGLGISKIRLTGGEPLIRRGIVRLVALLGRTNGIEDISLTTNAVLLKEYANSLKEAGLRRINISLDSLREDRYKFITRQGDLTQALEGIKAASEAGFVNLKINVLLLGEVNRDEITEFLRLTLDYPLCVRFLEFMPMGFTGCFKINNSLCVKEILGIAIKLRSFARVNDIIGCGPAKNFRFHGARGIFGLIGPLSDKFCFKCNRLRLTSDGFLRPCLHSGLKINLRDSLREGADDNELSQSIRLAVALKPQEHSLETDTAQELGYSMCQIGG